MSNMKQRCFGFDALLQFRHLAMSTILKRETFFGINFKYYILFMSFFMVAPINSKTIQCKTLDNTPVKTLLLPDKYSVNVEVKLMDEKTVYLIREDSMEGVTSLKVTNASHVVHCLYHYPQKQLVTVTEDLRGRKEQECRVDSLTPKTPCIPNSPWTIPLHELRQISNFSWFPEEKERPRGIETLHLELCEYDINHTITMKLDTYIAVNWILPRSNDLIDLVRLEFVLPNAHVISDYIDFFTNTKDPDDFLLPHGTFCPGLNISNIKPPRISAPFSVNTEIVDLDEIKSERLIFDDEKKLVLLETESRNVSLGAKQKIYDYNTGYKYTISLHTGQCEMPEKIRLGDFFVKGCVGKAKCEMSDPDNYFHTDEAEIQYVGKREVRGVMCDVWVGKYQDFFTNAISTIEWYYTSKPWTERIGVNHEDSVIFRMDIWEPGTKTPSIHNFFDFNSNPTVWSQFDISPCYSRPEEKIRFTIRLQANGMSDLLPYTTENSAVQHLQTELSSLEEISPILLSQTMVDYDMNKSVLYLTTTLLYGPKRSNEMFGSKKFRLMKDIFESISQKIRSKKWKVLLPIQQGSKTKNLQLTADKIWKSVTGGEITRHDLITTPSLSPTEQHTSPEYTPTKRTTPKRTHPSISTVSSSITLNEDHKTTEQTKMSVTTSPRTIRHSISRSLTDAHKSVSTSHLPTDYISISRNKQSKTTPRISSTSFLPEVTHSPLATRSTAQTTDVNPPMKTSSPNCITKCSCPSVSTNISCRTRTLDKDKNPSTATLIGCVCGSFVVGMLFAFVIVSFYSVFCRRKSDLDANSEHHSLTNMPYNVLQ